MNKEYFSSLKRILTGVFCVFLFLFLADFIVLILQLCKVNIDELPSYIKMILNVTINVIQLGILILIYKNDLKQNWKDFKSKNREYFSKYIKYWFWVLGLTMIANLIIQLLQPGSIAGNEETVQQLTKISPIYMFTLAVLTGPMIEELIFRQSFRYMFKNDTLFMILSGIVFGSLHVIGNVSNWVDVLYIIPYSIPGFVFAYTLIKSKNIFVPIGLHFIHNGILISLQIMLSLFM